MLIYIITFALTCLCCIMVEKKQDNKKMKIIFSVLAILIPSILAGLRSYEIGTDVRIYVTPMFELAQNSNILDFLKNSQVEFSYSILIYIISIFTSNVNWVLFFTTLIVMTCVYLFAYDRRKDAPIWLTMITFFMIIYNSSLNLMRQTIAISIILYQLTRIEKKQYCKAAILFIIALSFHKSVIFAIPIYLIMYFINFKKLTNKNKFIIFICVLSLLGLACLNYEVTVNFFANVIKIIPQKYYEYFTSYAQEFNINFFEVLYKIVIIISVILSYIQNKENVKKNMIYIIFLIVDFVIFPLSFKINNADRLGYYYYWPALLVLIPNARLLFKDKPKLNKLVNIGIICFLILYWFRIYIMLGFAETYPYKSVLLPILNLGV